MYVCFEIFFVAKIYPTAAIAKHSFVLLLLVTTLNAVSVVGSEGWLHNNSDNTCVGIGKSIGLLHNHHNHWILIEEGGLGGI